MSNEIKLEQTPPREYYERPYLPSANEASNYLTIPLLPVEAHTILVGRAGKPMSELDRLTLQRISEMEESDVAVDLKEFRIKVATEFGIENDWE